MFVYCLFAEAVAAVDLSRNKTQFLSPPVVRALRRLCLLQFFDCD